MPKLWSKGKDSWRYWGRAKRAQQNGLTPEEHLIEYLRHNNSICTKRRIRSLVDQGLDIAGYPFLVYAILADCSWKIIEFLLELGADPYLEDPYTSPSYNAITTTIRLHRIDLLDLIIKHKHLHQRTYNNLDIHIDIDRYMSDGQTPFHVACTIGNTSTVHYLLARGANPTLRDTNGNTPLHLAVRANSEEVVALLLQQGCDPNPTNNIGNTPLTRVSNINIAQLLLDSGAHINHRNNNNDTVLHKLVKYNNINIIKLILNYHANPLLTNKQNRTPIDIARYHEHKNGRPAHLSEILIKYSHIVQMRYKHLITTILIQERQEKHLNRYIFDFLF